MLTKSSLLFLNVGSPILQTRFGKGIMDEDFRRGRPIYTNDAGGYGKILLSRKNNNLPVRPSYNVGVYNTPKLLNYQNVGVNKINNNVNVNAGAGLDRLGRGGSYDVYGRGITPLLNKAGLGQVQTTRTCGKCHGTGEVITDICESCNGKGRIRKQPKIKV